MVNTTITVPMDLKERLSDLKVHPKQPLYEVISDLVKLKERVDYEERI